MKNKEEKATTESNGRSRAAGETPSPKNEFRLPRNALDQELAEELVVRAREGGLDLVGPDGLLSGIVGQILETALEVEMTDELGYERHERSDSVNARNGTSPKTLQTDVGSVRIKVPRDRAGSFDPVIVPKHSRRLSGFDDQVISLYAKGFTTGDIVDHVADIYGAQVSKDLVTKVTDAVVEELGEWQSRPLDPVWPVLFIDAIYVKIRDGQVANRPIYVAMGINVAGERDVLGLWAGTGGESAKHWAGYLTELKNRGIRDVMIVACDGLPRPARGDRGHLAPGDGADLCRAPDPRAAALRVEGGLVQDHRRPQKRLHRLDRRRRRVGVVGLRGAVGRQVPGDHRALGACLEQFIPFLDFPVELRKLIYTTNAIESLNSRFRQAVRRRGHFPHEQAAMKVLYLCVKRSDKNRSNPTGRVPGWKKILNTLVVTYGDRIETAIK